MIRRNLKHIVVSLATGGMLVVVLFLLLNATSLTARAAPGDLFVTPAGSGDCSQGNPCALQTALDQAVDGDNLYLAQGTYTGSGGAVITLTKSLGLYGGWDGSTTTPILRNFNTYPTTLDGEETRQVINISGNITPTIDGFVITRGYAPEGGGIYATSSPIIKNNVITDNTAYYDSINDWNGYGGGIYVSGGANTVISQNRIFNNHASVGGGIYHYGYKIFYPITISMNEIVGNSANHGGGITTSASPDIVHSNIISGNSADKTAGGMLLLYSPAQVDANMLINNSADYGGGIYMEQSATPIVHNNILVDNSDDGIYVDGSSPVIVNNTIVAKSINSGQGIYIYSSSSCEGDDCSIGSYINNIIIKYENGIYGEGPITPTIDYNDAWNNIYNNFDLPGGVIIGTHNISLNPAFVNTITGDYHLRPNSPCVNAGDPAGVPPAPLTDIDGQPRPAAGRVDIGADEIGYSHYLPILLR